MRENPRAIAFESLTGTGYPGCGKTRFWNGSVTGHDFTGCDKTPVSHPVSLCGGFFLASGLSGRWFSFWFRLCRLRAAAQASHPTDEDLSLHPKKQRALLGDPGVGTPA